MDCYEEWQFHFHEVVGSLALWVGFGDGLGGVRPVSRLICGGDFGAHAEEVEVRKAAGGFGCIVEQAEANSP